MSINLVCHNSTLLHPECWASLSASYDVNHVYVSGGIASGMVDYDNPVPNLPGTIICVRFIEGPEIPASLDDFVHPDEAVYVFGPDDEVAGWSSSFAEEASIYIPTPSPTQLYSHVAAGIVLNDRRLKEVV